MKKSNFHPPSYSLIMISGKKHTYLNSNLLNKCRTQYISQPKLSQNYTESIHSIKGKIKLQESIKLPKKLIHFEKSKYQTNIPVNNDYINFCTGYQHLQCPKSKIIHDNKIRCKSAFTKHQNVQRIKIQKRRSNLFDIQGFVPYKMQQQKYDKLKNIKPHRLMNKFHLKVKTKYNTDSPNQIAINQWEQPLEQSNYFAV